jgi:hypothetical protein
MFEARHVKLHRKFHPHYSRQQTVINFYLHLIMTEEFEAQIAVYTSPIPPCITGKYLACF